MVDKKKPRTAGTGTASKTTFDSRHHTPTAPQPGTQEARRLAELQAGRLIDPLGAWLRLGIYRLADCAYQLRQKGWPVVTERLDVINRFSEVCHVAQYRLAEGGRP